MGDRGLSWFAPFGVDSSLISKVLSEATARGADFADLYFEHRTVRSLGLEDGAVNRAYAGVDLGVGVRVV
ncbi:MAG: TldD/PmbA family protein, partial [Deltaproteobacteria bacterium]|nr:TldD/PmbA family protein [Deltaproteobacteria bacterium]